jgi:hypothetical protein
MAWYEYTPWKNNITAIAADFRKGTRLVGEVAPSGRAYRSRDAS